MPKNRKRQQVVQLKRLALNHGKEKSLNKDFKTLKGTQVGPRHNLSGDDRGE